MIGPPNYFQYLSANLNNYAAFAQTHQYRRKVLFVGANDGFLHAFDAGVWDRDNGGTFDDTWDLGTGREIFAYAPSPIMSRQLPGAAEHPAASAVLRGRLDGQGGRLHRSGAQGDPTPDPPHLAERHRGRPAPGRQLRLGPRRDAARQDRRARRQDGVQGQRARLLEWRRRPAAVRPARRPATIPRSSGRSTDNAIPRMGQTWSRPTVGRIRVLDGGTGASKDKYVAIFGGGFDPNFRPGDPLVMADQVCPPTCPARKATAGRSIYIVDVETGKILSKITQGNDSAVGHRGLRADAGSARRRGLRRRRLPRRGLHRRRQRPDVARRPDAGRGVQPRHLQQLRHVDANGQRLHAVPASTTRRRPTARRPRRSRSSRSSRIRPSYLVNGGVRPSARHRVRHRRPRRARADRTPRSSGSTTSSTTTRA